MSNSTFTPPPYKATMGTEDEPERWIVVSGGPIPYHIATIENGQPGDSLDTEAATAHLFAAAPLLYEALRAQELYEEINHGTNEPVADDPRFTAFIGNWNGEDSWRTRLFALKARAKELRKSALASAQLAPRTEEVKP